MSAFINLTGQRFGSLLVQSCLYVGYKEDNGKYHLTKWVCLCDCGMTTNVMSNNLRRKHTTSCGCMKAEISKVTNTTHGASGTPEYRIYGAMLGRVRNPNDSFYSDYGGRGITVADEWVGNEGFTRFIADMGPRPSKLHTLDRIDNSLGYSKANCRWATAIQQANNKRNNRLIEFMDKVQTLAEWCRELNLHYGTVMMRLRRGTDEHTALTTPTRKPNANLEASPC